MNKTTKKAWALVPRVGGRMDGALHVVRVEVLEQFDAVGAALVREYRDASKKHFLPFARMASTLPRLRAVVRSHLGKHEKSARAGLGASSVTAAA